MKVTTLSQKNKGKTCDKMTSVISDRKYQELAKNLSEKLTIEEVETYLRRNATRLLFDEKRKNYENNI